MSELRIANLLKDKVANVWIDTLGDSRHLPCDKAEEGQHIKDNDEVLPDLLFVDELVSIVSS